MLLLFVVSHRGRWRQESGALFTSFQSGRPSVN